MFVELCYSSSMPSRVQGAEFDGMLKDIADMSRGFVSWGNRDVILIFVGFMQTDVMALISKGMSVPHAIWHVNMPGWKQW